MAKLFYITCDLKSVEDSPSLLVANEFLNEYMKWNPQDEIRSLDLYRDYIQRIDTDVLSGNEKINLGHAFVALTDDEQRKISRIWRLADQFIDADKYVFATPRWTICYPAEFKIYIDSICLRGKTFEITPEGPRGLLKAEEKKCLHIHTVNGTFSEKHESYTTSYFNYIMNFMGIKNIESIVIQNGEGHSEQSERTIIGALRRAKTMARDF